MRKVTSNWNFSFVCPFLLYPFPASKDLTAILGSPKYKGIRGSWPTQFHKSHHQFDCEEVFKPRSNGKLPRYENHLAFGLEKYLQCCSTNSRNCSKFQGYKGRWDPGGTRRQEVEGIIYLSVRPTNPIWQANVDITSMNHPHRRIPKKVFHLESWMKMEHELQGVNVWTRTLGRRRASVQKQYALHSREKELGKHGRGFLRTRGVSMSLTWNALDGWGHDDSDGKSDISFLRLLTFSLWTQLNEPSVECIG